MLLHSQYGWQLIPLQISSKIEKYRHWCSKVTTGFKRIVLSFNCVCCWKTCDYENTTIMALSKSFITLSIFRYWHYGKSERKQECKKVWDKSVTIKLFMVVKGHCEIAQWHFTNKCMVNGTNGGEQSKTSVDKLNSLSNSTRTGKLQPENPL